MLQGRLNPEFIDAAAQNTQTHEHRHSQARLLK